MAQPTLTPKQRSAIVALLEHGEISAAATAANVARGSLYTWLQQPAFVAALREAETDLLRTLTRQLLTLGTRAIDTFAAVLADPDATATVRLRAADSVIGKLLQLRELSSLEERVAALEAAAAKDGQV